MKLTNAARNLLSRDDWALYPIFIPVALALVAWGHISGVDLAFWSGFGTLVLMPINWLMGD